MRTCVSGNSLHKLCTRCNSGNWGHFVPASWRANSNQLNFMQNVAGTNFSPRNRMFSQKRACHTRKTVATSYPASCPCNMSFTLCQPWILALAYWVLSRLPWCIISQWLTTQSGINQWFVSFLMLSSKAMRRSKSINFVNISIGLRAYVFFFNLIARPSWKKV